MSHSRRKLLLGLGLTAGSIPWAKPVINSMVLPAHAQCSPDGCIVPRAPSVASSNIICTDGMPSSVTFDLTNNELEAVTAIAINPSAAPSVGHVSPAFPFTIEAGETVSCMVESLVNSTCADFRGFGYNFTSESGLLEGVDGAVSVPD